METYDAVVVGAGIQGSATAYNLARNGQHTLLLEQFPLPHSRGSSHGQTRIIRRAYGGQDAYSEMMPEAYQLWQDLEKEAGSTLYRNTGILFCGPGGGGFIDKTQESLRKHSVPHASLDAQALQEKYPMLRYPRDTVGVEHSQGGVLMADKALTAFQNQFIKNGGVLHDNETVTSISPGAIVTVRTNKNSYRCRNLVLTVGPWATKILPPLGVNIPLKTLRMSVFYWKSRTPDVHVGDTFPTVIQEHTSRDDHFYGLVSLKYPGLYKLCWHKGPEIDPDVPDDGNDSMALEKTKMCVAENYPLLEPTPAVTETCIYTNTPDYGFVLDRHPTWTNIVIGAGFSGHGFKLAPVVGKLLTELVMRIQPTYSMFPFRIDRFHTSSTTSSKL